MELSAHWLILVWRQRREGEIYKRLGRASSERWGRMRNVFFFLFSLLSWRRPFSYLLLLCDDGVGSLIDAASVLSTRGMFYPLVACHRFSSLLRSIAAAAAAATATTFPCTHKSTRPRARHQWLALSQLPPSSSPSLSMGARARARLHLCIYSAQASTIE